MSCIRNFLFCFHHCLFEHSCLHRWLERCVWESYWQGKIARSRWRWYSFHHWHWLYCCKKWYFCCRTIISCYSHFMKHSSLPVGFSQHYQVILRLKDCEAFLLLLLRHWPSFFIQILKQMSISYQYHSILFLVDYGSIHVLVCIWYLYYVLLQTLSAQVTGLRYLKS